MASGGIRLLMLLTVVAPAPAVAAPVIDWELDQLRPAVAYHTQAQEYLVVWEDHHAGSRLSPDIIARRVGADGLGLGSQFAVSFDGANPRLAPAVAYNSSTNEYLVVWEYEFSVDDHDIHARRLAGCRMARTSWSC